MVLTFNTPNLDYLTHKIALVEILGYKDIGIRKSEFVTKNQFLSIYLINRHEKGIYIYRPLDEISTEIYTGLPTKDETVKRQLNLFKYIIQV